ncbi:hypothetical protein SC09_Contig17orf00271 [Bacillus subtilis]|uniref:Uncharacterized protein n=1 Tax=Bacillus subtilis TaxID=1423 RepID=A0A0D1LB93_BACIU|nr:hypothetical protein SC09_Contig17orf00271 [Bacillus subtilis]
MAIIKQKYRDVIVVPTGSELVSLQSERDELYLYFDTTENHSSDVYNIKLYSEKEKETAIESPSYKGSILHKDEMVYVAADKIGENEVY